MRTGKRSNKGSFSERQIKSDTNRRTFLQLSAAVLAAPWLPASRSGHAVEWVTTPQPIFPPSPVTRPWMEELPSIIVPVAHTEAFDPAPTIDPNTEAGRRDVMHTSAMRN